MTATGFHIPQRGGETPQDAYLQVVVPEEGCTEARGLVTRRLIEHWMIDLRESLHPVHLPEDRPPRVVSYVLGDKCIVWGIPFRVSQGRATAIFEAMREFFTLWGATCTLASLDQGIHSVRVSVPWHRFFRRELDFQRWAAGNYLWFKTGRGQDKSLRVEFLSQHGGEQEQTVLRLPFSPGGTTAGSDRAQALQTVGHLRRVLRIPRSRFEVSYGDTQFMYLHFLTGDLLVLLRHDLLGRERDLHPVALEALSG